jgi:hypothetical protein
MMYDFNSISNRLMKTNYQDFDGVLKKFLVFLSNNDVIREYLDDCGKPSLDVAAEVNEVYQSYDSIFSTGETNSEENANIFAILKYLSKNNINIQNIANAYGSSTKYDDVVKGFNERFILILIRNIEGYLTKIGIDMGIDETIKYNITVNNGQVNLASDNAIINATVNNGVNQIELEGLLNKIIYESKTVLSDGDRTTVQETIEFIKQELIQEKPRKALLRGMLTTLQGIKGTAEFFAAVTTLIQFFQQWMG